MKSEVFPVAAIVFAALAVFIAVYTASITPSRPAGSLGRRGRQRIASLATKPTWATWEPLVRWIGARLSGLLPERVVRSLDREITHAGDLLGLTPEEYVALGILGGIGGGAFGAAFDMLAKTGGLCTLAGGALGMIMPHLEIAQIAQKRFQEVNRRLPYAVDLLSLGMSAGLDFPGALRQVVAKSLPDDPLAEEFEYVLHMLNLAHTRKAALTELAERVPTEAVREFVHTVAHAEERGNPLSEVLVIQAQVSRVRRTTRAEEEAAKAGVKMLLPLAFIFLGLLVLLLAPVMMKLRDQMQTNRSSSNDVVVVHSENRLT